MRKDNSLLIVTYLMAYSNSYMYGRRILFLPQFKLPLKIKIIPLDTLIFFIS